MNRANSDVNAPAGRNESRAFLAIFLVGFVFLLGLALAGQLLHWQWRSWLPGAENEKHLLGGVKAAVHTFMPHLT
jgi:light-harvesting complex 1 beta chain